MKRSALSATSWGATDTNPTPTHPASSSDASGALYTPTARSAPSAAKAPADARSRSPPTAKPSTDRGEKPQRHAHVQSCDGEAAPSNACSPTSNTTLDYAGSPCAASKPHAPNGTSPASHTTSPSSPDEARQPEGAPNSLRRLQKRQLLTSGLQRRRIDSDAVDTARLCG